MTRGCDTRAFIFPSTCVPLARHDMPGDETAQKRDAESDSENEEGDDDVPKLNIDVTKLTPLSPEVISKQVRPLLPAIAAQF